MTPLLLLLWFSAAIGGVIFLSGVHRNPPRQLFAALNEEPAPSRPDFVGKVLPIFICAVLIAIACQPLATWLAALWPLSADFPARTGAWGRGLAFGVGGVFLGAFLPADENSKSAQVSHHGPVLLALPLAMIASGGENADALLGVGLGWALASCGLWRHYQETAPLVLLPSAAFAVLSALAVAAASIRDETAKTVGFGWTFAALGIVLATLLMWTVREKGLGLQAGRGALAIMIGVGVMAGAIFLGLGSGTVARNAALLVPLGAVVAILSWVLDADERNGAIIPPLGVAALISAAMVAHLLLQGVGVALCLLLVMAVGGWLPARDGEADAHWWTLLGTGAGIVQFRFWSIQAETSWPDSGWGDFYVLLGLLAAGCVVTWCAQSMQYGTTRSAEPWMSLFLVLFLPAATVILFGARPAPALLLGGLAAVIFSHSKSALVGVLCNFVLGLFLLQWLEVWLVLADMPRVTRIIVLAGIACVFGLVALVYWVGDRQTTKKRSWDSPQPLSGERS